MAEEFGVAVGQPDAPSMFSGTKGRYLMLGGIGVAVAGVIILVRNRGSSAPAPAAGESAAPGVDAAIAIGSLEQQIRERTGALEQQLAKRAADEDTLFGGFRDDILGGFDQSSRQLAQVQADLSAQIAASKADVLAAMGVDLDGNGSLSQQIERALSHLSEGQRQIFDQQWSIAKQQAAANWQIFARASDPNWMPSENDPVF